MTNEQFEKAEILLKTIATTKESLLELTNIYEDIVFANQGNCTPNFLDDGMYHLCISRYGTNEVNDWKVNLARHGGNLRLLKVIIDELQKQLEEYMEQFNQL